MGDSKFRWKLFFAHFACSGVNVNLPPAEYELTLTLRNALRGK